MKKLLVEAIGIIPPGVAGDGIRKTYRPGYYEIGVALHDTNGHTFAFVHDSKSWR